jgi:hypothetical protein
VRQLEQVLFFPLYCLDCASVFFFLISKWNDLYDKWLINCWCTIICDNYVTLLILFLWRHAALPVQINTSGLSRADSNQRESPSSSSCRTGVDPCTQQNVILSFFFLGRVGFDTYMLYWTCRCAGPWVVPSSESGKQKIAWKMCCCCCFVSQLLPSSSARCYNWHHGNSLHTDNVVEW